MTQQALSLIQLVVSSLQSVVCSLQLESTVCVVSLWTYAICMQTNFELRFMQIISAVWGKKNER